MTTFSRREDRHMTATAKMWRVRDLPVCVSSRSEDEELLANEKLLPGSAISSSLCGFHVSLFSQIQLKLLKTEFMMSNWGVVCTKWVWPSSASGETASCWSQTICKIINSVSWCNMSNYAGSSAGEIIDIGHQISLFQKQLVLIQTRTFTSPDFCPG